MNSNNLIRFVVAAAIVLLFATMSACAKKPVASVEQADVAKVEEAVGAEADALLILWLTVQVKLRGKNAAQCIEVDIDV